VVSYLMAWQTETTDRILRSLIEWLMGWPAGFKLNENLDRFLGRLFLYYIDKWSIVTGALFSYVGITVIRVISLSGVFGISVMISLVLDLAAFLTAHITCFYYISARFHHLELVVLSSLWKLFRGMKYNPLKHRIDSSDYEFDQLLLGTILLTLLVFLFPTTAVYYIFFTSLRLVLICFQGLGGLALELLNYFPIYHLLIYFTHPELMPSGIRFAVDNSTVEIKHTLSNRATNRDSNLLDGKSINSDDSTLNEDLLLIHKVDNSVAPDRSKLRSSTDSFSSSAVSMVKRNKNPKVCINPVITGFDPDSQATTYLRLESQPVLIGSLFFHLHQFISNVLKTYTFPKLVKSFLTGAPWSQFQN